MSLSYPLRKLNENLYVIEDFKEAIKKFILNNYEIEEAFSDNYSYFYVKKENKYIGVIKGIDNTFYYAGFSPVFKGIKNNSNCIEEFKNLDLTSEELKNINKILTISHFKGLPCEQILLAVIVKKFIPNIDIYTTLEIVKRNENALLKLYLERYNFEQILWEIIINDLVFRYERYLDKEKYNPQTFIKIMSAFEKIEKMYKVKAFKDILSIAISLTNNNLLLLYDQVFTMQGLGREL